MAPIEDQQFEKNDRNRVKRGHNRALYDAKTVYDILDSHFLCHVGFEVNGQPFAIPTSHWREGNRLYWHGASKSMMIRHLSGGTAQACVTVTQLDGLVLARSAFNTSVNYRSAMCYGTPELVTDEAEWMRQMKLFFDRLAPGRWQQLRQLTEQEIKATGLLVMEIEDASAKVRAAPPGDDPADMDHPVWAGVVPMRTVIDTPEVAPEGERAPLNHPVMADFNWQKA